MTGIVVIAHGNLARELVKVASFILEEQDGIFPLDIDPSESPEEIQNRIKETLLRADQGQGVLILTDLFGGTPSNLGLVFLEKGKVEVVSGVNLPMLIKAFQNRELPAAELATLVTEAGKKAIVKSSDLLEEY